MQSTKVNLFICSQLMWGDWILLMWASCAHSEVSANRVSCVLAQVLTPPDANKTQLLISEAAQCLLAIL